MRTTKMSIIHSIVILAVMFLVGFLPPIPGITPLGMKVLGVFLSLLCAYTFDIIMWPSILALIYLASFQGLAMDALVATSVGNKTLLMIATIFMYTYALNSIGLLDWIGRVALSLKIVRKGPYWMMTTFLVISCIGSALMFSNAGIVLMLWAIFYNIAERCGIKKYSAYSNILLITLCICSYQAMILFPFSLWPNIITGLYASIAGTPLLLPFGTYFVMSLTTTTLMVIATVAFTKFVVRPKIDFDLSNYENTTDLDLNLTTVQKFGFFSLLFMFTVLIAPSFMPAEWAITGWLSKMNITGALLINILLLSFFKKEDGKTLVPIDDTVKYGIGWKQFFLLMMVFYMSTLLTSDATGIKDSLLNVISGLLDGKGLVFLIIFIIFFCTILTNCINNTVSATLMMPFLLVIAPQLGDTAIYVTIAMSFVLLQGCALPSGSTMGGLMHANKDWLHAKDVYLYSAIYTMLLAAIVCCVTFVCINVL